MAFVCHYRYFYSSFLLLALHQTSPKLWRGQPWLPCTVICPVGAVMGKSSLIRLTWYLQRSLHHGHLLRSPFILSRISHLSRFPSHSRRLLWPPHCPVGHLLRFLMITEDVECRFLLARTIGSRVLTPGNCLALARRDPKHHQTVQRGCPTRPRDHTQAMISLKGPSRFQFSSQLSRRAISIYCGSLTFVNMSIILFPWSGVQRLQ